MSTTNKAAKGISNALLGMQRNVSDCINKFLQRASIRRLRFGLAGFVVVSVAVSGYVIVDAVTKPAIAPLEVQPIRVAPHMIMDDEKLYGRSDDEKLEQYLLRYQRVIDSIRVRDSIKNKRYEK